MTSWARAASTCAIFATLFPAIGCGDDDGSASDAGRRDAPRTDTGCVPECADRECGDDGCGGTCGEDTCPGGLACGDDGRCPTTAFARFAHLVPNAGPVDVCVYFETEGAPIPSVAPIGPLAELSGVATGLPFRGVSGFVDLFDAHPDIEYRLRVYLESDAAAACPAPGATAPAPLIDEVIAGVDLAVGAFYTIGAVGFADVDGADPSFCGATLSMPCSEPSQQPHLELYAEELLVTDPMMTKLRFLHAVPNLPPLDVCLDGDPTDAVPGTEIFADVAYPSASAFLERAPVTAGFVTLHLNVPGVTDGMTCAALDLGPAGNTRIAVIPVPWPDPVGTAMVPGSVKTFDASSIATMFASGRAGAGMMDADRVSVIPFATAPSGP